MQVPIQKSKGIQLIWQLFIVILFCNVTHILEEFRTQITKMWIRLWKEFWMEKQMFSKPNASNNYYKINGRNSNHWAFLSQWFFFRVQFKNCSPLFKKLPHNYYDVQSKSLGILLKYDDLVWWVCLKVQFEIMIMGKWGFPTKDLMAISNSKSWVLDEV